MNTIKGNIIEKEENKGAEILSIGSELLLGNILNTNAQWLAEELAFLGIPHFRQTVIGDNSSRLKEAILEASSRCQILITTGGLGPTPDDITTKTIASAFNTPLEERNDLLIELKTKLKDKGYILSKSQKKQCLVPSGSEILKNSTGTASGIIWSPIPGFLIMTFPGVSSELKEMWKKEAFPWLVKNRFSNEQIASKILLFSGISESSLADKIPHLLEKENPTVATYASLGQLKLRITARGINLEEANKKIEPIEKELVKLTGSKCYGENNQTIEELVIKMLINNKESIAVAESCTGGGLASALTKIPGSSKVFSGGIIAYNNSIKQELLGVAEEIITKYGAVSSQVVEAMSEGVQKKFKVDWSISISGIAGPSGGSEDKPIGLVSFCIKGPNKMVTWEEKFGSYKTRKDIQKLSVLKALDRLRLCMLKQS